MPDYNKPTGNAGTLRIRDTGTRIEFYILCSDPITNLWQLPWSGTINGSSVSGTVSTGQNFGSVLVASWAVSTAQTVNFNIGFSGTSGVGGPTNHSAAISRGTVPPAPTSLSVDQATTTSLRYRFQSNGGGGGTFLRFEYQRSTSATFASGNGPVTTSSGTSTATGLTRGTRYYFRSRGVNTLGNGSWSSIINGVTLHTVPDKSPLPTIGTVTATSIAWTATNPSYIGASVTERATQISRFTNFSTVLSTSPASGGTFSGLSRKTTYYIRHRVRNAIGWGAWSDTRTTATIAVLPTAPTGYYASDVTSTGAKATGYTVSDNGGNPLTDVRAQINTSASATGATLVTVGAYADPVFTGLTPGVQYHFRLAVASSGAGGGWSPYGAWVTFTTSNSAPTAPTGLAASAIGNNGATLSWGAPASLNGASLTSYKLRVGSNFAISTDVQEFTTGVSTFSQVVGSLLPGTEHYARVWTTSNNGLGASSSTISFTTTGIAPAPAPVRGTWMRFGATWRLGHLWQRLAGLFPSSFHPSSPGAYPGYAGGEWVRVTVWQRVAGAWRKR